ncbi:MAG: hypothetical protein CL931_13825 [Deltaproteobacteria bacterium]|nr:hypothetical protein [Deltaproteobacteria bacterium]
MSSPRAEHRRLEFLQRAAREVVGKRDFCGRRLDDSGGRFSVCGPSALQHAPDDSFALPQAGRADAVDSRLRWRRGARIAARRTTSAARLRRLEFLPSQGRSTTAVPCSLRFLIGCLSVVQMLAWIFFAPAAFADAGDLASFVGQWARVVDVADDQGRIASIESATGDLSWIVRKMATGVLGKSTQPAGDLTFFWSGDEMRQQVRGPNGDFDRLVELGAGPKRHVERDGAETTIEWMQTADGLEVHWAQDQAYGRNLYRIDPEGQTLHVEHRLQVTAVEGVEEIVYGSRFERIVPPPVSAAPAGQTASGPGLRPD